MSFSEQPEVFEWKGLKILQSNQVHKVGTDAILLGAWIPTVINQAKHILDVGTGTGILAIMMNYAYPTAHITAIDEDRVAVDLAIQNVQCSGAEKCVSVKQENLFHSAQVNEINFELIVCNPPYFFSTSNVHAPSLSPAKHTQHSPSNWMKALDNKLLSDGHICIVIPYPLVFEWMRASNAEGLYCSDRLDVYSFARDEYPVRTLLHLTKAVIKPNLRKLSIYEEVASYTNSYLALTGIQSVSIKMDDHPAN